MPPACRQGVSLPTIQQRRSLRYRACTISVPAGPAEIYTVANECHHVLESLFRQIFTIPEHPIHAQEVTDAHQALGQALRVEAPDLPFFHSLGQTLDIALRQTAVIPAEKFLIYELSWRP
jgi:hypothetical protein